MKKSEYNTLFIGGSGLLGRTIKNHLDFMAPSSSELDVTKIDTIIGYLLKNYSSNKLENIVLSAAYTNSGASNREHETVNKINILGPRNLIRCVNSYILLTGWVPKITYISSDYVFKGDVGMYATTDTTYPVPNNYYAYSKGVAEEIIKTYDNHMIIRTSFCEDFGWKYPVAFYDKFTSCDKVSVIAPMISDAIILSDEKILHIATERKSVFELASSLSNGVIPGSRLSFSDIGIPLDTSLKLSTILK